MANLDRAGAAATPTAVAGTGTNAGREPADRNSSAARLAQHTSYRIHPSPNPYLTLTLTLALTLPITANPNPNPNPIETLSFSLQASRSARSALSGCRGRW